MAEEKKKPSWFGRLRPKKSSCCSVVIEEIGEEGEKPSCCGGSSKRQGAEHDENQPAPGTIADSR